MSDAKWKDALWNLLDILPLRRVTARIALSAGLIGLAAQSSPAGVTQARVPVSPVLAPEATVRRLKGRYVLKRVANALTVRFAGHGSHRSHSSHASHASHRSSSHYSGAHSSHFSSSPSPSPVPAPSTPQPDLPRSAAPRALARPPKAVPMLQEEFDAGERVSERWRIGVLATAPETLDSNVTVEQSHDLLNITPIAHTTGAHFNGYVSISSFDLNACSIAVQLRHAAAGASTIFAVAIDAGNWRGFWIEGGQLVIESHTNNRVAAKKITYDPLLYRFLRLRTSNVAPVVVWETSADGTNWNPEYVETEGIHMSAIRIVLSAGTTGSNTAGAAAFDNVIVERKP